MARRRPLLEGYLLAWSLALGSGLVFAAQVEMDRMTAWTAALAYVGVLSLIAYVLFAWDKRRARRKHRRVSEANLLWLIALGGAAGGWIAMLRLRHKNQHLRFRVFVPIALFVHAVGIVWLASAG